MTGLVRSILGQKLYRNSLLLIADSAVSAGLGFVFWTLAARTFDARTVGTVAAVIGALTLASAAATFGLPNTMLRYLAGEADQRALLRAACVVVAGGGGLAGAVWAIAPGHLGVPISSVTQRWWLILVILAGAIVASAVGNVADAGLIALREPEYVLATNALGGVVKVVSLLFAATLGTVGLLGSYLAATAVAAISATAVVTARARPLAGRGRRERLLSPLAGKVTFAAGNHLAALVAILPTTTMTALAVAIIGARDAAYLAMPLMIVGLLNVVPAMVAQSLYADLSADPTLGLTHIRRALRATYVLAIPAIGALAIAARPVLALFGPTYASRGAGCLQLMALAGVFASFNYLADAVLLARSKVAGYLFLNITGAAVTLALPVLFMGRDLRGVGLGWVLGQVGYTVLAAATLVVCFRPELAATTGRSSRWLATG